MELVLGLGNSATVQVSPVATITGNVSGLRNPSIQISRPNRGELSIWAATPELRFAELAFDHLNYTAGDQEGPRLAMSSLSGRSIAYGTDNV